MIKRSDKEDSRKARVSIACERGGVLTSNDDWSVKVVCGFHNHQAAKQLEGHSYAGRLSDGEKLYCPI